MRPEWFDKQIILFLAADATGAAQLDRVARSIATELAITEHRDCFHFVTHLAAEPQDVLRKLRTLKPTVVHFGGPGADRPASATPGPPGREGEHGRSGEEAESGLSFMGRTGEEQWVSVAAIAGAFEAVHTSVKVVVLNTFYSATQADELLRRVPCVIWVPPSLSAEAARSFAVGFYGGLGDGESVHSAYKQGRAAIPLEGQLNTDLFELKTRSDVDATQLILAANQPGASASAAVSSATARATGRGQRHRSSRWRRVAMRIRTALTDGQGAYLLAMLAFGAAAASLYRSQQPERVYHEALADLLKQEQEPYRAETRQMAAAGLLSGAAGNLCEDKLIKMTDDVVTEFTAALPRSLIEAPRQQAPRQQAPHQIDPLPKCENCEICPCEKDTPDHNDLALTDNPKAPTLIVPSTVAELVNENLDALNVLRASRQIEQSYPRLENEFNTWRLKSIYFIHPSGGIRIIPAPEFKGLPPYRTFAGSSYWYNTLKKEHAGNDSLACPGHPEHGTLTKPYFDIFGSGVVRTLCRKIDLSMIAGILCFDFSPPETTIHKMLEKAADLFDLRLVSINKDDGSWEECKNCPESLVSFSKFSKSDVDHLVVKWNGEREARQKAPAADGTSAMTLLEDGCFGAIVQSLKDKSQKGTSQNQLERRDVVFVRVQRSHTHDYVSAVLMAVFAMIASGLIIAGVRKKAKRLDLALIRSLQVGVGELDIRDNIVGANDRAQEIFGVELPAFDLPERSKERPFGSLIHPIIVRLDDAGRLPPGPVTFSEYESLMLERAIGHSSSYYAITKLSEQVIRISGSTFVDRNIEVHTFGTIETFVDPVDRDRVIAAFHACMDASQREGQENI
jgi:hypothetical protein